MLPVTSPSAFLSPSHTRGYPALQSSRLLPPSAPWTTRHCLPPGQHITQRRRGRHVHHASSDAAACLLQQPQQCSGEQEQQHQHQHQQSQQKQEQEQPPQQQQQQRAQQHAPDQPHQAQQQQQLQEQQEQQQQPLHQHLSSRAPLPPELRGAALPQHIAVIMDGNARWASRRGLSTFLGHQAGLQAFNRLATSCNSWGIRALTVFAFSSENWQRDAGEVSFLMSLFSSALRAQAQLMNERGVRLRVIGNVQRLPMQLQGDIDMVQRLTASNTGMQLTVALSYSGQDDIVAATKSIAQQAAQGLLDPEQIDQQLLEHHLSLAPVLKDVGPPDLLIRTSGERRLSNFLLWELAYSELVFLPLLFPDFDDRALVDAILEYQTRVRRFGARDDERSRQ